MEINRELNEILIENTHSNSGSIAIEWALEAIAVALYRIANALEKQNEEEIDPESEQELLK
ncbi:hypothetical protein BECAL_02971 [Bellilinea caldifistulae]|uniref:Uncharacterized protein n=1 Tax=Bellilinea caldifistulae TaxID=360411 RepID=A0A0P6X109_9CHLR|nr:hypothetical protein [Bellilinea caldifistulae]KPL74565.1 hypothetical protein AC812_12275 [Bellilinea caldifistulae]GAP11778.1 hypothetical protein BECAL_02971 [Bellilinea caldifistulae]